ncbi:hypothetical protein K0P33_16925 [Pseudomonas sp. ArH3a]|uniref:hypothetical protein n=1 Tax=Pseudomonas sp. ArH3a TaxID=2862945 RepID=UPI001F56A91A|nr:hypothetical protein [Pseudomonas sp. ArH3a]UNM17268.1 hypothetical protein K0P33_16925 [Pseudomonas sp. ArH3a]
MQILIVILLAIIAIAVAPWLVGIVTVGAIAYSALLVAIIAAAVLAIVIYAGYFFLVVCPRRDKLEAKIRSDRDAKMRSQDAQLAAQKRSEQEIIDARARATAKAKASEDLIQAEVDEQIREAEIRKALKVRS